MFGVGWRLQDERNRWKILGCSKILCYVIFVFSILANGFCWEPSSLGRHSSNDYSDFLNFLMEEDSRPRAGEDSRLTDEASSRMDPSYGQEYGFDSEREQEDAPEYDLRDIMNYILDGLEREDWLNDKNDDGLDDGDDLNSKQQGYDDMDDIRAFFQVDNTEGDSGSKQYPNSIKVAKFLKTYQKSLAEWRKNISLAGWTKSTNLTKPNIAAYSKISLAFSTWQKGKHKEAEKFDKKGLTTVQKRMLKFITRSSALLEKKLEKINTELRAKISSVYSKAEVCDKSKGKCYHFEPGLIKLFRKSRDYDKLLWAWKGWRDAIGPKIRRDWILAEEFSTLGATEHGYHDEGEYIRDKYEDPNFVQEIDSLWNDIEPLFKELHAYVRYKLHLQYGNRVALDKPIPAHLLGDMWAMKWDGILDIVQPYPKVGGFDVTKGMKEKNMTTHQMFVLADNFYQSIGLPAMPPAFWTKSMFTRPKDGRPVICYASAHNIDVNDVRVKMCAVVNAEYLYVVHHEMGHCQYYLAYNHYQPTLFQAGANNGFHEAIGDTAALSVISPTHLNKLGILHPGRMTATTKTKKDLNFLMEKALAKLAFYPFAMTMAKWRWNVFSGNISSDDLNSAWWQYKKRYQGIEPPVKRSEKDFDPGSKYHITFFVPYIRYFISHVLQFQFYESMCKLANQEGPLHKCDFAGSKAAGHAFEKMLRMGSSKPWPDALQVLTNTRKMSVQPMIRYFTPLLEWLKKENKRLKLKVGWD